MTDSKPFTCANGKGHLPPLDPQADAQYREAVALAKSDILRPWGRIMDLYSKVAECGHWKAMRNLVNLYRTEWSGGVEKDTQKALDLYQKMIDLEVSQGFYDTGAMIGNRAGVANPTTDGFSSPSKAASLGNPPALTELDKLYVYVAKKKDLGLTYAHCATNQGYAPASYELGVYYKIVEHNLPKALGYYQAPVSQGGKSTALFVSGVFDKASPDADRMWYASDEKLRRLHDGIYDKLAADLDFRFPNLIKDRPLPFHPTQSCDVDRLDWKLGQ